MKNNHWVILCIILFFIVLIYYNIFPVENLDNQHYIESNNLVNSSCKSFYDRQYVFDNQKNEFIKNEMSVNIHSKTKKYCILPAVYNECDDLCECPEGYLYDADAGCVTPDYYNPPTPTSPPTTTPPIKKKCPAGYVYDRAVDGCLGICLRNERYDAATDNCIKDCSFSWTEWTKCGYEGKTTREPIIYYQPNKYGKACPTRETSNCIIDCSYSWSNWSSCDVLTGTKMREPIVEISANILGKACPTREVSNCIVDCSFSWSDWTTCSTDNGKTSRTSRVYYSNLNGGKPCPPKEEIKKCDVDCSYSWSDWTDCDMFSGTQTSELNLIHDSWNDGKKCPVEITRTRKCGIDCAYNLINQVCNMEDGYYYYTVDMARDAQNTNCYYDGFYGRQLVSRNQLVKSNEQCSVDCDIDLISPFCNPDDGYLYYVVDVKRNSTNSKCYYKGQPVEDNQVVKSDQTCPVDCSYELTEPSECVNGSLHKTVSMKKGALNSTCVHNGCQEIKNGDMVDSGEYCEMPASAAKGPDVDCKGYWGGWSDCKKDNDCKKEQRYFVTVPQSGNGAHCEANDGDKRVEKQCCFGNKDICFNC